MHACLEPCVLLKFTNRFRVRKGTHLQTLCFIEIQECIKNAAFFFVDGVQHSCFCRQKAWMHRWNEYSPHCGDLYRSFSNRMSLLLLLVLLLVSLSPPLCCSAWSPALLRSLDDRVGHVIQRLVTPAGVTPEREGRICAWPAAPRAHGPCSWRLCIFSTLPPGILLPTPCRRAHSQPLRWP